ncbi:LOG family protein [Microvenator marinus]|nr:LOG family protein [Microvenator marinus]
MTPRSLRRKEVYEANELKAVLETEKTLAGWVIRDLDLSSFELKVSVEDAIFLGCTFDLQQKLDLIERGAHVFPKFSEVPYEVYRHKLYSPEELLEGWETGYTHTTDYQIYAHFDRARKSAAGVGIREALAQRIHDHGIDDGIEHLISRVISNGSPGAVGIMGGHGTKRNDPYFEAITRLTFRLATNGFFVTSGGGPGIMEAANLGAYLSTFEDEGIVDFALETLSAAPKFDGGFTDGTPEFLSAVSEYIQLAKNVCNACFGDDPGLRNTYQCTSGKPGESLAIPTWFYGHEPTNLFGTHVAKYFSNSLREDNLLAISTAGVVFAPGSAGTLQEVFMDLAQNHYATFIVRSPMVFLGVDAYSDLFGFIKGFVKRRGMETVYGDLLLLTDDIDETVEFLKANPPR